MDSITELVAHYKQQNVDIPSLTVRRVASDYTGSDSPSLMCSLIKREYNLEQNPPKKRRQVRRKRRPRKDTGRKTRRSFHAEQVLSRGAAMLELVERVNGSEAETEVEDNPLQLVDTSPGETWPTFVVVHPDDDPDWLTDRLPATGKPAPKTTA
jgi:hypothetical protein